MTVIATKSALAGILLVLAGAACGEGKKPEAVIGTTSRAAPATSSGPAEARADDDLRPVYPLDAGLPDPLAQRYCDAVYDQPVRRMSECCGPVHGAAAEMSGQCVRVLTAALASRAVSVDGAAVDRCVEAMQQATAGCDWVTPSASVAVPPACDGAIHGALGEKARCRSSLECAPGLRCQGLSTIDMGTCGAPKAAGHACNLAVDTLAAMARQDRYDRAHPECAGYCAGRRCEASLAEGAACKADVQCGKGRCAEGRCASSPPPEAGGPCATSACAFGLRCVQGRCAAPKADGDACSSDAECRGACDKGDGGMGKCGKQCSIAMPAPPRKR
jgi:hypothetical protein